MKVVVHVERWAAWSEGDPAPRVDFLLPLQRRRVSPLARMVLDVVWRVVPPAEHLPTVFASRHGEVSSTHRMLTQLVAHEPLSAAEFSHSVHNSIVGQASIFRHDRSESVAVSAGADTLPSGFIEAAGLLLDHERVLLAIYDEPVPEPYLKEMPTETERWALAVLLTRAPANVVLERQAQRDPSAMVRAAEVGRALPALFSGGDPVRQSGEQSDWVWSHRAA